ncbi:MAG: helix-turn-helix transcriptional regulator [Firmicutes bacterium]|nr:helix-turn-helix transcriptional regulator [Bacillota bacterium]
MSKSFKKLREDANLNTKKASEKLNISLSMLYKIEQGRRQPSAKLIRKMSNVYKCSTDDIFLALKSLKVI